VVTKEVVIQVSVVAIMEGIEEETSTICCNGLVLQAPLTREEEAALVEEVATVNRVAAVAMEAAAATKARATNKTEASDNKETMTEHGLPNERMAILRTRP